MITKKVTRNDPCPCGSGKKYKKCCGAKETVSITALIEREALDLQGQIIDYAMNVYDFYLEEDIEERFEDLETVSEQELEFYQFVHSVWYTLFVPLEDGKTILQRFIEEQGRMVHRSQLREILQSWTKARPIAGRLLDISDNQMIVKDAFTDEIIDIKMLMPMETDSDAFLFGMVVPFGQEQVFFTTAFDLEASEDEKEERFLQKEFAHSGYDNPVEFLTEGFLELMNEMQYVNMQFTPDDFEWTSPAQKETAELIEKRMQTMDLPPSLIAAGLVLWFDFCQKEPNPSKKPASYAAAIHYIDITVNPLIKLLKKEIAALYQVSVSSLSRAIKEIEEVLADEIMGLRTVVYDEILEAMEAGHFDFDDDEEWTFDEEDDDDDDLPF
jgi:uncharacterized protein YecA (UPF0149 family)